jgi:RNA polymerase sigma factor (sigma-70 family)
MRTRATGSDPTAALDDAWRDQWGRLTALLVAQFRRLDLAEDGLADAYEAAARTWPRDGVPANPPAWLLTSARRRILDRLRAEAVAAKRLPVLAVEAELQEEAQRVMADAGEPVRDERLRLVMLCAHPALSRENAAALTLRMVMGVSTADIARLFLVPTTTMAARLTRSRKSLAGERFEVPLGPDLKDRLDRAADVAYLAFTAGYTPPSGSQLVRTDLTAEAIRLARLLRELLPGRADLDGLLGLMLLQHSRRDARVRDGRLVLLPDQDRSSWHGDEITEALDVLTPHVTAPGTPYLLQALIAAEHAIAPHPDATDWPRIVERYDELLAIEDTPVVRLNRAVAISEADGPLGDFAHWTAWSCPTTGCPACAASCWRASAAPPRPERSWLAPSSSATTTPSAPISPPASPPSVEASGRAPPGRIEA